MFMTILKYHGHANFQLIHENTSILIDPFFTNNPTNTTNPADIDCQYILVSHAHGDHIGDAVSIAQRTGATIISTAEVANMVQEQGCQAHPMHIGGKHAFPFGSVKLTMAIHGAGLPGGHACGFVIDFFDKNIYFAGDTALFSDMELIGRLTSLDYALLPIGDNYTMGPEDALIAASLLKPQKVIPMHYNTWPLIAQAPDKFKQNLEITYHIPVHILPFGESMNL
jgi:L-ascorbate metabolism protein UlaG (beta-lactamase superfamily)